MLIVKLELVYWRDPVGDLPAVLSRLVAFKVRIITIPLDRPAEELMLQLMNLVESKVKAILSVCKCYWNVCLICYDRQ